MAQSNVLKRYLDAGMAFTSLTQAKAEALVKDLVRSGEVQTEQTQAAVTELLERSRANTEAFIEQVRQDVAASAESLGLATVADLARLERLIESIKRGGSTATARATAKKRAPAKKKAAAKKAPAKKKAAAKKAPAKKKAAAKKAPAKKSAS
jgi:polyhydroxyalkanoate synthesis regulator phasin